MMHLYEIISYRRTVWITGFLKTTVSSAVISTGVVLLFNSITEHPYFKELNKIGIVLGTDSIILTYFYIVIMKSVRYSQEI